MVKKMQSTSLLLIGTLIILLLAMNRCYGDYVPPRYTIDLDVAPENRWDKAVSDHKEIIPAVVQEIKQYVPKFLRALVWWISEHILLRYIPDEYAREIRGIAERSGLRVGEIVGINILYDISAFRRGHIFGSFACTSIVAEDRKGRIIHGRNLDYDLTSLLKNLTIIADFTRNGEVVYTAVTFVLHVGLCTGQRHGAFSISLNERYSGGYIDTILMELYTHFRNPVTIAIRKALEEMNSFGEAKDALMKEHFVAPSYLILAGNKSGQACIITRDRWRAADVQCINPEKHKWFLVETNFDHWKEDKDKRRKTAEKELRKIGRKLMSYKQMLRILSIKPVLNNATIFSTVMSPTNRYLIYNYTVVRDLFEIAP